MTSYEAELPRRMIDEGNGKSNDEILMLSNLLDIEIPGMDSQEVCAAATIASNSVSYTIPYKAKVRCISEGEKHSCKGEAEIEIDITDYPKFADVSSYVRNKTFLNLCMMQEDSGFKSTCKLVMEKTYTTTIKKLRARPIVKNLLSKDNKFFDHAGREWKAIDIFMHQNGLFTQPGKIVELTGQVLPDPKTSRITLMVSHAKEVSEGAADIQEMEKLAALFEGKEPKERMQWIVSNVASYIKAVNRENVIHATLLCYFSPLYLEFNAERIKGWTKVEIIGDSTTAKSKIVRTTITDLIGLGQIITGEMASMAGLAAANTQASSGQWMVEYGPLVLQDSKILAVDGAHKVSASDWAAIGEAERDGVLRVNKAAKAEANARTRLLLIYNPLSDDRRLTRAMDTFRYAAQALETVQDATSIARVDFAVFVNSSDVTPEQVHIIQSDNYDERIKCLTSLCRHVWSGKYEIEFTKEATNRILKSATELFKKFNLPRTPLVSMDIDKKIARLSTSLAAITCSFNKDWQRLTVEEKHVEYVVEMLESEYMYAGLNALSAEDRQEITSEEAIQIFANLKDALKQNLDVTDNMVYTIVAWVAGKSNFTRDELMHKFHLSEKEHLRPLLSALTDNRLIKRGSRGLFALPKLIKLARLIPEGGTQK